MLLMENIFDSIDDKYFYEKYIGEYGFSKVYLVTDNYKKEYAAKIIKEGNEGEEIYDKELKINQKLSELKNPNIAQLVSYNKEGVMKTWETSLYYDEEGNNQLIEKIQKIKYLIFEYANKGRLSKYACFNKGFKEGKVSKYIFKKIVETVQVIHNNEIYHLDLNLNNILLSDGYNIKIIDFGLAETYENTKNGKLNDYRGTKPFEPPQMEANMEYDPIKADIFSLGVTLFVLVWGTYPFCNKDEKNELLDYIKYNKKTKINKFLKNKAKTKNKLSEDFKTLFINMISFDEEKRPSINEILKYPWLNEIEEYDSNLLEEEVKTKFNHKDYFIERKLKREEVKYLRYINESYEDIEEIFHKGIKISKETEGIDKEYYIRIEKDNYVKIVHFMNLFYTNLKNNKCLIEPKSDNLEFNIIFNVKEYDLHNKEETKDEYEESEENNEDKDNESGEESESDDEENICDNSSIIKKLVIQVKMFKSLSKGYILIFNKKEGELIDFYSKIKSLMNLAEKKISESFV